jgi:hypothetical protein
VGQRDRGFGAVADIGVVIGEGFRLLGDGVGDLAAAIADIDAIEAGEGVEQPVAIAILDIDARAAREDPAVAFAALLLAEMGRGMEEALPVPGVELVIGKHFSSFRDRCQSSYWLWAQRQSRQTYLTSV